MPIIAPIVTPGVPLASVRAFQAAQWGSLLRPSRPAQGHKRRHSKRAACPSAALTLPVDPTLALWQQPAVHRALLQCGVAIAGTFLASSICMTVLRKAANKELGPLTRTMDGDDVLAEELGKRPPALQMFETATVALQKPLQVLLNAAAVVVSGRFLAAFLQIVLEVHAEHDHIAPGWQVEALGKLLAGLDHVGYLAFEGTEVALIVLGAWVVLRMKEQLVSRMLQSRIKEAKAGTLQQAAFEQVILPLSGMGSWVVFICGALMSMHVLGINLAPLLTVGGISGIVVGLSAQALLGNIISGLNLYISRPFVVGDSIEIRTGSGAKVVSGFVDSITPMRTNLRTADWLPISIPNKVLSDLIISNESRIESSNEVVFYNRMRTFHFEAKIRYQDFDVVESILQEYKAFLKAHPLVDKTLPMHVYMSAYEEDGLRVSVSVHSVPSASRSFVNFKQDLLLSMGKIVKSHGADFAWKDHVEFSSHMPMVLSNGDLKQDVPLAA